MPKSTALHQTIGDTLGIGGIFRGAAHDPGAARIAATWPRSARTRWLLNYTNPMAMLCWATYAGGRMQKVVGLCHSVQYTRPAAPSTSACRGRVDYLGAGMNHHGVHPALRARGEDLYPRLRRGHRRRPRAGRRPRPRRAIPAARLLPDRVERAHGRVRAVVHRATTPMVEHFHMPVDEYVRHNQENLGLDERSGDARRAASRSRRAQPRVRLHDHALDGDGNRACPRQRRNTGLITTCPADLRRGAVPGRRDRGAAPPVGALPPQLAALNRTS